MNSTGSGTWIPTWSLTLHSHSKGPRKETWLGLWTWHTNRSKLFRAYFRTLRSKSLARKREKMASGDARSHSRQTSHHAHSTKSMKGISVIRSQTWTWRHMKRIFVFAVLAWSGIVLCLINRLTRSSLFRTVRKHLQLHVPIAYHAIESLNNKSGRGKL